MCGSQVDGFLQDVRPHVPIEFMFGQKVEAASGDFRQTLGQR